MKEDHLVVDGRKITVGGSVVNESGRQQAFFDLTFQGRGKSVRVSIKAEDFPDVLDRLQAFVDELAR